MSIFGKSHNNGITIMDRDSIPQELIAVGVELIKLDRHTAKKGIPKNDIEKIAATIKNLQNN